MKKPKRRAAPPKPIPEPVPLLTFEEARDGILSPWFSGADLAAGTRIADAKGAAAHGLLAALNVNEGQRGVVRILVQSAEQKREVINFLTAFLSDEPRLKRLLKRATPDTFHLHGNVSIHVDANSARLGKDVIAQIVLDPTADAPIGSVWIEPGETKADAAARCGWKPEQVSQLMSIRWLDPARGEVATPIQHPLDPPIEAGPPVDRDHAAHGRDHGAQSAPAPSSRAVPPDPADLAAAEQKWNEACRELERERERQKIADHFSRIRQRGV